MQSESSRKSLSIPTMSRLPSISPSAGSGFSHAAFKKDGREVKPGLELSFSFKLQDAAVVVTVEEPDEADALDLDSFSFSLSEEDPMEIQ